MNQWVGVMQLAKGMNTDLSIPGEGKNFFLRDQVSAWLWRSAGFPSRKYQNSCLSGHTLRLTTQYSEWSFTSKPPGQVHGVVFRHGGSLLSTIIHYTLRMYCLESQFINVFRENMLLVLEIYHNFTFHCHPQVYLRSDFPSRRRDSFRNKGFS
jgi:hypothetical protein